MKGANLYGKALKYLRSDFINPRKAISFDVLSPTTALGMYEVGLTYR